MVRSGTIKTLAALVAALTVGTGVLIWMETDPARPSLHQPLALQAVQPDVSEAARAVIRNTDVPFQPIKWRNIIVHDVGRDGMGIPRGCHFVIGGAEQLGDGVIRSTRLWRWQQDGKHIHVPGYSFNENSIGICLLRDCRRSAPTAKQRDALMDLIRSLQATFRVPHDHVYLHADLGEAGCPGRLFPAEEFRQRLLRLPR